MANNRLFLLGSLFLIGTGLLAQTIRQNETASNNQIKTGLDQRKIEYTERELLTEYGVFGKSIFIGNASSETYPFLFVFPVSDCYQDLAFSLSEQIAASETKAPVVFLGDAWSPASFRDLLETLDNPQNASLMYLTQDAPIENPTAENALTENKYPSFTVTFFQDTIKNPFHLTGTFAKYLKKRNIPFSFRDKNIIFDAGAFPDINEAASVLLHFAASSPLPQTDPDIYYIAADFNNRKLILDNVAILKTILVISAVLLFVNLFFAVIFNKKRVLVITLSVFSILAGAFLLNNPLYSPKDTTIAKVPNGASESNPAEPLQDESSPATGVEVKRTVFLDRITYTIKAEYDNDPTHIAVFYDMEKAEMPAEVYESPFPYRIDDSRVTFVLGEYPPNPFETEISFPRAFPGLLTVLAAYEQGTPSVIWTEQPRPD